MASKREEEVWEEETEARGRDEAQRDEDTRQTQVGPYSCHFPLLYPTCSHMYLLWPRTGESLANPPTRFGTDE